MTLPSLSIAKVYAERVIVSSRTLQQQTKDGAKQTNENAGLNSTTREKFEHGHSDDTGTVLMKRTNVGLSKLYHAIGVDSLFTEKNQP